MKNHHLSLVVLSLIGGGCLLAVVGWLLWPAPASPAERLATARAHWQAQSLQQHYRIEVETWLQIRHTSSACTYRLEVQRDTVLHRDQQGENCVPSQSITVDMLFDVVEHYVARQETIAQELRQSATTGTPGCRSIASYTIRYHGQHSYPLRFRYIAGERRDWLSQQLWQALLANGRLPACRSGPEYQYQVVSLEAITADGQ